MLPNQPRPRLTGSLQSDGGGEELGSIAVKPSFFFLQGTKSHETLMLYQQCTKTSFSVQKADSGCTGLAAMVRSAFMEKKYPTYYVTG